MLCYVTEKHYVYLPDKILFLVSMSNNSLLFLTNVFINDEILFLFDPKLVVKNQAMIALLNNDR